MSFSYLGLFGAGLLTFISPCVLPLVPVFIASLTGEGTASRARRVSAASWFSLGFTLVFVAMGVGVSWLAPVLGRGKPVLLALGGIVFVLVGMKSMGMLKGEGLLRVLNKSLHLKDFSTKLPRGLRGLAFGALFGLSWTPCVGPVLGGVLTYVASRESSPLTGALYLLAFAAGISLPLILFAFGAEPVLAFLNRFKRHMPKVEFAMGACLFIFGVMMFQQAGMQRGLWRKGDAPISLKAEARDGQTIELGKVDEPGVRMVFFYRDNCPWCHKMEEYLPEFERACASQGFRFLRVNLNKRQNHAAWQRFNVHAVPTIAVLDSDGNEIIHLVGYQLEGRLREAARTMTKIAGSATGDGC